MARHKLVTSDDVVGLSLPRKELRALAECPIDAHVDLRQRARDASNDDEIPYTLDELAALREALTPLAGDSKDRQKKRLLAKVLQRIERVLEEHAAPPPEPSIEEDVPEAFREVYFDIVELTDKFCDERLNDEYKELCREMTVDVCQPGSPVKRGKRESWACGIVYSVGWVNFLTDPGNDPHLRAEEIAKGFAVSVATMHNKAKTIREGLDLTRLSPEFSLPSRLDDNPFVWMFEVNGLLVDIRTAPREVQAAACEAGLIPYVPADRDSPEDDYVVVHDRVSAPASNRDQERAAADSAFQIRIVLDESDPPIWRRVRVPDCTLDTLHEIIQVAMGWENYHMHEFSAGDERFSMAGMPDTHGLEEPARDESDVRLSELAAAGHKTLKYWYDFGDDWWHTLVIEKSLPRDRDNRRPLCLDGQGACPPEDVGGVWGYLDFLEALEDERHPEHEDYMEWCGGEFDPEAFDVESVNQELAAGLRPDD